MKSLIFNAKERKPYPIDQLVRVKFKNWRYPRTGYIRKDPMSNSSFNFEPATGPKYYRQIASCEPPTIELIEPEKPPLLVEIKQEPTE